MSYIFDGFPSRKRAEAFARHVRGMGLTATVYDNQAESNKHDPFPFVLSPPIVLVDWDDDEVEGELDATGFGGHYVGT